MHSLSECKGVAVVGGGVGVGVAVVDRCREEDEDDWWGL